MLDAEPLVWVTDSGFNSATNRAYLQRGGDHYIVCEKLRSRARTRRARSHAQAATTSSSTTSRSRRSASGRCALASASCLCNPEAKSRDEIVRKNLVAYLEKRIAAATMVQAAP